MIVYISLTFLLKIFNYTFLAWVKNISTIIILCGTFGGVIELIHNLKNKSLKVILYIVTIILTALIVFILFPYFLLYYTFNGTIEKVSEYEGITMIQEIREGPINNYIKYYDYINPFIKRAHERVYMRYDDNLSEYEYCGTTFYNKDGKEVEDIDGTEFLDMGSLKKFASEGSATYEDILNLLENINKNFEKNIYKVETSENYLFIYFTNNPKKFVADELIKSELKSTVKTFTTIESTKNGSKYSVRFWNGYVAICNDAYLEQQSYIPVESQNNYVINEEPDNIVENTITEKFDKSNVEYVVENNKYYAIIDNGKKEIISIEDACNIADLEAKNSKYQYQPWKSNFKSISQPKLILEISDIDRIYYWNEKWKTDKYKKQLMWQILLFDENDPLTSLYIYVDAINGDILGAGSSSD